MPGIMNLQVKQQAAHPLIRHFNLFLPNFLAFSSALEFSLSMTFDLFWEQTLYFLAFLIWKPDDLLLAPGKRENNFLSTIALGFLFLVFNHNSIIICCACALEMVWAAYKTGFQWITVSEDHPHCLCLHPVLPLPTKANCHLCFIENSIFKCDKESSRSILQKVNTEHGNFFSYCNSNILQNLYLGKYGCLRMLLDSTLIILREEESNQFKLDFLSCNPCGIPNISKH